MVYTSHGHHISGSPISELPETRARCGGPSLCMICSEEAAAYFDKQRSNQKRENAMTSEEKQAALRDLADEVLDLGRKMTFHITNTDQLMLISIKLRSAQQRLDVLINMGVSNGE